jgi:hypothetical protein
MEPNAPLVAGEHCQFCKALPVCPAQREKAYELAQVEFDAVDEPGTKLPVVSTLTDEQLGKILLAAPVIEDWFNAAREHVRERLMQGERVEGWKLVAKRATRRWKNEQDAEINLATMGLESIYTRKLLSPAQAEKALKEVKLKLPEHLVVKSSSGYNLAPDHDPRPALLPAAVDAFDGIDLPSGTTEVPS